MKTAGQVAYFLEKCSFYTQFILEKCNNFIKSAWKSVNYDLYLS